MPVEFDSAKNQHNIAKRGLAFDLVGEFEWATAIVGEDGRRDYGEERLWALAMLGGELHKFVFTTRGGTMRVISFRRASRTERGSYDEAKARS